MNTPTTRHHARPRPGAAPESPRFRLAPPEPNPPPIHRDAPAAHDFLVPNARPDLTASPPRFRIMDPR